jgi:dolichyl-phosphate-mannose--protein O-mannosyl transferase
MVGLFVIGAIGIAVIMDLWDMLDKESNKPMVKQHICLYCAS